MCLLHWLPWHFVYWSQSEDSITNNFERWLDTYSYCTFPSILFNNILHFSGHTRHEMTSWSSYESVFTFLQERYSALANKEELWLLQEGNMGMQLIYNKLPNCGLHGSYESLEKCTTEEIPSVCILVTVMSFVTHAWRSVQHIFCLSNLP
jgi:hypothetical protein